MLTTSSITDLVSSVGYTKAPYRKNKILYIKPSFRNLNAL